LGEFFWRIPFPNQLPPISPNSSAVHANSAATHSSIPGDRRVQATGNPEWSDYLPHNPIALNYKSFTGNSLEMLRAWH
jgi:hypothetical protein